MKKYRNVGISALLGGAYGTLGVFLSHLFLKNLSAVAGWIMNLTKIEDGIATQVTDALMQLKNARLLSPYAAFILIFAVLCALVYLLDRKARKVVINVGLWILLLVPVSLLAALFTHVNDILFFDIVRLAISIVTNL